MLKQRLLAVLTGITILLAVAGVSGVVADTLGLSGTSQAYACSGTSCHCSGGSGGGGC